MNLSAERRPHIEMLGYNLDKAKMRAFLVDNQNQRVDVSSHLGGMGEYLITLNLGANGVPLSETSHKIELQTDGGGVLGDINVIQPQRPTINRYRITVTFFKIYFKNVSEGKAGSYTGEVVMDFGVNQQPRRRFPATGEMVVRNGNSRDFQETFVIEMLEGEQMNIYVNGTEQDDGCSAPWCTGPDDPMGEINETYQVRGGLNGKVENRSTDYYTISYSIEVSKLP